MVAVPAVSTSVAADATSPGSPAARFCAAEAAFPPAVAAPVTAPSGFPGRDVPLGSTLDGFSVGIGRLTEGNGTGRGPDDFDGLAVADGLDVGDDDGPMQIPRMQV